MDIETQAMELINAGMTVAADNMMEAINTNLVPSHELRPMLIEFLTEFRETVGMPFLEYMMNTGNASHPLCRVIIKHIH